jgi:hypothetical protein
MTSKSLYTSFHQNQSHCANQGIGETLQRCECEIVRVWRVGGSFQGAAHTHRGARHTQGRGAHRARPQFKITTGAAHTQSAAHWVLRAAHTDKGPKFAKLPQIFVKPIKLQGRL